MRVGGVRHDPGALPGPRPERDKSDVDYLEALLAAGMEERESRASGRPLHEHDSHG